MISKHFKNKKVIITGHTGFKGAWLTMVLYTLGAKIMGISLKPNTKPSLFEILGIKNKVKNNFTDITNKIWLAMIRSYIEFEKKNFKKIIKL